MTDKENKEKPKSSIEAINKVLNEALAEGCILSIVPGIDEEFSAKVDKEMSHLTNPVKSKPMQVGEGNTKITFSFDRLLTEAETDEAFRILKRFKHAQPEPATIDEPHTTEEGVEKLTAAMVKEHLDRIEAERQLETQKKLNASMREHHKLFLISLVNSVKDNSISVLSKLSEIRRKCQRVIDVLYTEEGKQ